MKSFKNKKIKTCKRNTLVNLSKKNKKYNPHKKSFGMFSVSLLLSQRQDASLHTSSSTSSVAGDRSSSAARCSGCSGTGCRANQRSHSSGHDEGCFCCLFGRFQHGKVNPNHAKLDKDYLMSRNYAKAASNHPPMSCFFFNSCNLRSKYHPLAAPVDQITPPAG